MHPDGEWEPERAASPVTRGDDGWYRPDNLLVDVGLVPELPDLLAGLGVSAEPHVYGRNDDWRGRSRGPVYENLNGRLAAQGLPTRLWVVNERRAELHQIVRELRARGAGVHLNHVFFGEDIYHGGPDGPPAAEPGPAIAATSSAPANGRAHLAVLDTPMPENWASLHTWLASEIVYRHPVNTSIGSPVDENGDDKLDAQAGHGLFICGLVSRVARGVGKEVGAVLHATGEGEEALIAATLAETRAPVVNLSLGGYTDGDETPTTLASAVRRVLRAGRVVVAAAGNTGRRPEYAGRKFWPAALDGVIAVGACDTTGGAPEPADFSAREPWVNVHAPGRDVVSYYLDTWPDTQGRRFTGAARWSGTSFAAPLVAAEIARRVASAGEGVRPADLAAAFLDELPYPHWAPNGPARLFVPKNPDGTGAALDLTRWPSARLAGR
ncbi:S8 family peptidase [Plantactinospora sp. CA-290183]|uniref:S8 family peptidase n=1 Tax=Plantactinospora sp. CA-290183 TaxID=3240006 RepID=UPI003D91889D